MRRPRLMLADDHPAVLHQVQELLAQEFEIVAAVADGSAALDAAQRLEPDVAVLDITMPNLSGLDLAARLNTCAKRPAIVFLTIHDGPEFLDAARRAGAVGYVLKRQVMTHLLLAVRAALANASSPLDPLASPAVP